MMHKYFDIQIILYFYISKSCKDITRQDILSRLFPNSSQISTTPQSNLLLIIKELKINLVWVGQNHREQIIQTNVSLKSKLGKPDKGKNNALHKNIIKLKSHRNINQIL